MKIRAATLAGGKKNQDAYIIGDNFAGVFDGASNHTSQALHEQDAAWYSRSLAKHVGAVIADASTISDAVGDAITRVAESFEGPPEACPTSTVALARWRGGVLETYVLGDSSIVISRASHPHEVISDDRMNKVANGVRAKYRERLRSGTGFDPEHHDLLRQLQSAQRSARNKAGGYWIAGADPTASAQGLTQLHSNEPLTGVAIATDGGLTPWRYGLLTTWESLASRDLDRLLRQAQKVEEHDMNGQRWPRSKLHDDKSLVHLQRVDV